jgi:predicted RNA-binding protein (virulence factor B family)
MDAGRSGSRFESMYIKEKINSCATVKPDGKLDLSIRRKAHLQMDEDAEYVMQVIDEFDGVLPFNDKVSPEIIQREFKMSKNAFKRAVGRLYKEGRIEITENRILKR